jgi:competence protein ComEA
MGFSKEQQVVLLLLGLAIFCINLFRPFHPVWSKPYPSSSNLTTQSCPQWIIEVAGAVKLPGIYSFDAPPTGNDALQRAGGLMNRDCPALGQMSTPLETGTRVEIGPSERESGRVTISPIDPGKKFVLGIPIPLNQAGAEALAIIPGISHSLARRIVEFRDSHGPFKTWHELRRVKGIGPKKVERFQSYLSLTETSRNQE